jgi:hypothetical protein
MPEVERPAVIQVGVTQVVGSPGPEGPPGPPGPEGPQGSSVGNVPYRYRTASVETDPGSGNIKCDTTDPAIATEFYASVYDSNGAIVRFDHIDVGGIFGIYVSGDIDTWDKYTVTGPVVNHENTWFSIPVAFHSSGPLPFDPSNGTQVQVQTPLYDPDLRAAVNDHETRLAALEAALLGR